MNWIKKNLFLVVGGVVALGLLGAAVYILLNRKSAADEVTALLAERTAEYTQLMNRDPHPNTDNIEAAKREQQRLEEYFREARQRFTPPVAFTNLDAVTFKKFLENTISELERDAERAGVNLPAKYDFTFKSQRVSVVFTPETLMPLATQLAEIRAICDVVFNARVPSLVSVRRPPVAKEDEGTTDFLTGKKPVTNAVTGAIITPYEVVLQGFSTELAGVLAGFASSPVCFVVKNVDVQTNVVTSLLGEEAGRPAYPQPTYYPTGPAPGIPQPSAQDIMRQRYGLGPGGRYGGIRPGLEAPPPPVAPVVPATPSRRGPETVLDERPLKITLFLESVRLAPPDQAAAAKPRTAS